MKFKTQIALLAVSLVLVLVAATFFLRFYQTANEYKAQQVIVQNLYDREELVSSMLQHLGYGHFIHHFKNYILRQETHYLDKAERDYENFSKDFEQFLTITPDNDQLKAIQQIKQVISTYREKLELLRSTDLADLTAEAVDELVKINDTPAKQALIKLHYSIKKESHLLNQLANDQLQQLYNLVNFGLAFLVVLCGFTAAIYYVLKKLSQSESRLEHAHSYLNEVLNNTKNAVLVVKEDTTIIDCNSVTLDFSGYDKKEITELGILTLLPKLFSADEAISQRSLRKKCDEETLHLQLQTKSGDWLDVDVSFSVISTYLGRAFVVVIRDVARERQLNQELIENQKMLNQSQEVAQFGSWHWNLVSNKIVWSQAAEAIYGLTKRQLGNSFNSIIKYVHPEDRDMLVDAIQNTVVLKSDFKLNYRLIINNDVRYVQEVGKAYVDQYGEVSSILGTVRDITLERKISEQLAMSESVFLNAHEGIFVTDAQRHIQRINKAFTHMTGFSEKLAIGKKPEELLRSGKGTSAFYHEYWSDALSKGDWSGEIWEKNARDELILTSQYINAVTDEQGNVVRYLAILSDITKKRELEDIIRQKAYFDALTNLPNRSLFIDRLKVKLAEAKRHNGSFALCFMDLDGFKAINDTHGHNVGDKVLIETSNRLANAVRESDTVSRLAGDEFTLILDEIESQEVAIEKTEQLIQLVNLPIMHNGIELKVGASCGVKIVRGERGQSIEELLKQADQAMYQAKEAGKNRVSMFNENGQLA